MKRIETIKERKEFNGIIKTGKYIKNKLFVIYIKKNESNKTKFGVAISNKTGKANVRNKLKRQTRTLIDNNRNLFNFGYNYIIMIRKNCTDATFDEMNVALTDLLEKQG